MGTLKCAPCDEQRYVHSGAQNHGTLIRLTNWCCGDPLHGPGVKRAPQQP